MVNVVIPFLMSMFLGRTIDLRTYKVGESVYDHDDYDETPLHVLNSTYNILQQNVFPYTYIGIPADLVLRIKSNSLKSASGALGLDGLLKETTWKSKGVTVAVASLFQTVYRGLKDDAKTVADWTTRVDREKTHYVSSIIYGGWSIIFYKYQCTNPADEEIVRNILISDLGVAGLMNEETVEMWKRAETSIKNNKEITGNVDISVDRYSSVVMEDELATPEKVLKGIKSFQYEVGKLGQPLFMELQPLNAMDSRYPKLRENMLLSREMENLDELYDDLQQTQKNMRHWLSTSLVEFTDEEEELVTDTFEYVSNCLELFKKIAGHASLYNPMDLSYLKSAMTMYKKGISKEVTSYNMLYRRLKEDIDPQCEKTFGPKMRGVLKVNPDEKMHIGEMRRGLDQCKEECLEEEKCRAIGYAEEYPTLEYHSPTLQGMKIVIKHKQCWIYFRSSKTSPLVTSKTKGSTEIYDRTCY